MPLYTSAEIKAKIIALDAKIDRAESEQATVGGGPSGQSHQQRGDLRAMYEERRRWIKIYEEVAAQESGSGNTSLVQFEAPS
jgi:hypothetical protein